MILDTTLFSGKALKRKRSEKKQIRQLEKQKEAERQEEAKKRKTEDEADKEESKTGNVLLIHKTVQANTF